MVNRWMLVTALGLLVSLTSGCPEPSDEAGDGWGGSGESGETGDGDGDGDGDGTSGDDDGGSGLENDGNVRPPLDTGDGDGDGDGDPAGDPGGEDDFTDDSNRCWDRTWNGDILPALIIDNTVGRVDDSLGSCGIDAAPDFQLGFMAPWTGSFTFDTIGSSFDTILYAHEGECSSTELACNDDFIGLESRITLNLEQGEIVTVTVDGAGAFEEGPLKLLITEALPPVCIPELIPPILPAQLLGDTTNALNQLASGCGGSDGQERVYQFIAPLPGTYRFDTEGSSFDTVLYTLDECAGPPLACNDDFAFEQHSQLDVQLLAAQSVLIVVDGREVDDVGAFVLNVKKL
ncbi:hypothetical protein [Enhygromyxa salina]|uniref:Uncharacterized protein n=1 Tax=Enhygromyxa salina TaxID=215803 RepID=A0A2S9YME6_9BACT|nr:hypothetical protein [Enhygromyxa salina]PRQ06260.1 hypothetical protein ENSA7_40370 [Enhygromyxa salina]